ncbi:DUF3025 domain-containing protein [Gallaecimonas xiamenensis]|uniref:DUF3025 domain-containing protein n=1 Tax=Gallaecimonas xiamenensis TaxID=1207039 RepID=UPI0004B02C2C|nr:DUF3025 domain-containing protein [Gallaecimonas xiamenensis]
MTETDVDWQTTFLDQGLYQDLATLFTALGQAADFPDLAQLGQWLAPGTQTLSGQPVQFCADAPSDYYEAQVLASGRVPTRERNWHDLFNALAWALFPRAKAMLNGQHVADIDAHGLHPRTLRRDSLTLFDECGVLVVASDLSLLEDLRQHRWQSAFVARRGAWGRQIEGRVFGHAVYEQGLTPYLGLTAKMFPVLVEADYFAWNIKDRYGYLDQVLALALAGDALKDKALLSPLPLLGVPGWWPANAAADFYDNTQYFRSLSRPRPPL